MLRPVWTSSRFPVPIPNMHIEIYLLTKFEILGANSAPVWTEDILSIPVEAP